MITLVEKRKQLELALLQKTLELLKAHEPHPKLLFKITSSGQVEKLIINAAVYHHLEINWTLRQDPTKKSIAEVQRYIDNLEINPDKIKYRYDASNSYSQRDIRESPFLTFEQNEAEFIAAEIIEKLRNE